MSNHVFKRCFKKMFKNKHLKASYRSELQESSDGAKVKSRHESRGYYYLYSAFSYLTTSFWLFLSHCTHLVFTYKIFFSHHK